MTKPIIQQYEEAERAYQEAFSRHPRSARTTVLWAKWRDLKVKLIALETKRERAA